MKTFRVVHFQEDYPILVISGVSTKELWDNFEAAEIIGQGVDSVETNNLVNLRFKDQEFSKFWFNMTYDEFCQSYGDPSDLHVTEINVQDEVIDDWIKQFSEYIKNESSKVGGDDSYYDYFPDIVEIFRQVCIQLNMRRLFNDTLEYLLNNEPYKHDEEGILGTYELLIEDRILNLSEETKIQILNQWTNGDIDLFYDCMNHRDLSPDTKSNEINKAISEVLDKFSSDEVQEFHQGLENLLGKETNGLLGKLLKEDK